MNILVCGFMGSGKTTFVERFRHNSLGYEAVDLDTAVAANLGIMPSELGEWINKHGMELFREKEMFILKNLLHPPVPKIIALGGGTVEGLLYEKITEHTKTIFLNTSFETCFSRIKNDSNRPLIVLGMEGLRRLYETRLPKYQNCDLTLSEAEIKEIEGLPSLVHNLVCAFKPTRG